jgi:integrating conjugative element protein (TIGR03765 family)
MPRIAPRLTVPLLTLALVAAADASPPLAVLHDSGDTEPLAPYLEALDAAPDAPPGPPGPPTPDVPALGAADRAALLPIESPGLTPGPVSPRSLDIPFSRPFFLVGSDPRSRAWLRAHRDELAALGAVGMLVEAKSAEDLRAIAALAEGLPIQPASGSDLAAALGLRHYPVLITREGLVQ